VHPVPLPHGPDQESVWNYPRPPRLERSDELVEVRLGGESIATTRGAWRVLETSHPPTYYVPREDVVDGALVDAAGQSWCEWKGRADYFDVVGGDLTVPSGAWTYRTPSPGFEAITGAVAFYPGRVECYVDGERVVAQPGGFYGGWITSRVTGPFKGAPGTMGW
jgi:uncharacterized protein (DUF427 family)